MTVTFRIMMLFLLGVVLTIAGVILKKKTMRRIGIGMLLISVLMGIGLVYLIGCM